MEKVSKVWLKLVETAYNWFPVKVVEWIRNTTNYGGWTSSQLVSTNRKPGIKKQE